VAVARRACSALVRPPAPQLTVAVADSDERRTTLRSGGARAAHEPREPGAQRGDPIGRYVVLDRVGAGGTGEVLRAYDPELDRRVAIKLLHPSGDPARDHARLFAEARALAKLQHPNIVAVHDVGLFAGRVFMAMAYVDGEDLATWLARSRPRAEVLDALLAAGTGLAAAHAAGLVHGDIKPSNVLIRVDPSGAPAGVFVVDFGLAAPAAAADESSDTTPAGTPAYLAPERYTGRPADARSDLFAFATTVFEALTGASPWSGADEHALLLAKRNGTPTMPAAIPVSLRSTLRRALQTDPEARPTLDELRDALRGARGRGRSLWIAAGVSAIALAGASWWSTREPCPRASVRTDAVWGAAARSAARAGVLDSGASHAQETWTLVESRVEAYVQDWLAAHRDACEATHVRHEQSAELLERINVCLDRRLHQVGVLVDLLAHADREVVDEAARASTKLPPLSDCDRATLLDAPDEATGPEADRLRAELDRVEVLETVGAYDDALAIARACVTDAEPFPPLRLEARYRVGRLLDLTGDHDAGLAELTTVHWDAEAGDADRIAALAGIYVVYTLAGIMNRPDEALAWAPHVRASIERAGGDPLQHASLTENIGVAHLYRQEHERALELFRETLEDRERAMGEDALPLVSSLNNLGIVLEEMKRYDEAIEVQARALAIVTAQVGGGSPHTARVHDNLGTALLRSGRTADALEHFGTALEIRRTTFGEDHRSIAMSYVHLGLAALEADEPAQALQHYEKALAIYRKSFAESDRQVLLAHEGLAHASAGVGDWPAVRHHADIALRGLEPLLGAKHAEILGLRELLARAATQ
jgi:eukaryotic-like serine/threonine-protein kinase